MQAANKPPNLCSHDEYLFLSSPLLSRQLFEIVTSELVTTVSFLCFLISQVSAYTLSAPNSCLLFRSFVVVLTPFEKWPSAFVHIDEFHHQLVPVGYQQSERLPSLPHPILNLLVTLFWICCIFSHDRLSLHLLSSSQSSFSFSMLLFTM